MKCKKTVAVISSNKLMYKVWLRDNKVEGVQYIHVSRPDDVFGAIYHDVKLGYDYEKIRDYNDLISLVESRKRYFNE